MRKINKLHSIGFSLVVMLTGCGGNGADNTPPAPRLLASTTVVAADYTTIVQQLYTSYFGRPADTGGLSNFSAQLAALGAPTDIQKLDQAYRANVGIKSLVDSFGLSAESAALYSGDNTTFITAIYSNVLGRAPDATGLAFWVGALNSGAITKANASLSIMAGALANSTPQGLLDGKLITNRIFIASYFTSKVASQNAAGAYSGDAAAASARALLAAVTATTDTIAYEASVTSTVAALSTALTRAPGIITTVAGDGKSTNIVPGELVLATSTGIGHAGGIAVDASGNLYIADAVHGLILKVSASNGIINTVAGHFLAMSFQNSAPATSVGLDWNNAVAVDAAGNIYFPSGGHILKRDTSGFLTSVAGDPFGSTGYSGDNGPATNAKIGGNVNGIAVDNKGNIYFSDTSNRRVRKIDANGIITTVAGNGVYGYSGDNGLATNAQLAIPYGVAVDASGNIFISDIGYHIIRKVATNGIITTVAGGGNVYGNFNNVPATSVAFSSMYSVTVDADGNIYFPDYNSIVKVTPGGIMTTVAGGAPGLSGDNTPATSGSLANPWGVAVDANGNIYIAEKGPGVIRKVQH